MRVEFSPPDITEEEIAEVIDTLKSGWITTRQKSLSRKSHNFVERLKRHV